MDGQQAAVILFFVSFPELFSQLKGHIHSCQKVARNQIHFQWDNLSRRMIPSWCWCKPLRRKNVKTHFFQLFPETFLQQFSFPFNTWIIYFVLGNPIRNIIYVLKINKSFDLILSNSKWHMTWSNYFKLYVLVVNEMIGWYVSNGFNSHLQVLFWNWICFSVILGNIDREHSDKHRPNKLAKKIHQGSVSPGDVMVGGIVIVSHSLVGALSVSYVTLVVHLRCSICRHMDIDTLFIYFFF